MTNLTPKEDLQLTPDSHTHSVHTPHTHTHWTQRESPQLKRKRLKRTILLGSEATVWPQKSSRPPRNTYTTHTCAHTHTNTLTHGTSSVFINGQEVPMWWETGEDAWKVKKKSILESTAWFNPHALSWEAYYVLMNIKKRGERVLWTWLYTFD